MKQIGQGRTADIFGYDEDKIIKLYKMEFPKGAINQEFLNSNFTYSLGIKTPQPFGLTDLDNRCGLIFQRISGPTLLNIMTKRPWTINKLSRILANLHFELHTHEVVGVLSKQKVVLNKNIRVTSLLTEEEKEKIIDYLEDLPEGNMLCHGDFHPDNVLVNENNWIIDWMTGASGNPAGDVARSVILFSFGTMPDGTPKMIKIIVNFLKKRLKTEYIKHYLRITGIDYAEIDKWLLPVATARLAEWIPKEEQDKLLILIKERLRAIS